MGLLYLYHKILSYGVCAGKTNKNCPSCYQADCTKENTGNCYMPEDCDNISKQVTTGQ
jgi:hypothetical protein